MRSDELLCPLRTPARSRRWPFLFPFARPEAIATVTGAGEGTIDGTLGRTEPGGLTLLCTGSPLSPQIHALGSVFSPWRVSNSIGLRCSESWLQGPGFSQFCANAAPAKQRAVAPQVGHEESPRMFATCAAFGPRGLAK